jgi:ABC-type metal ion transport system substrate-binding protein
LKSLKKLDLGANLISEINLNGFQDLDYLEELDLIGNVMTKIEANSFQHLKSLKKKKTFA